MPRNKEYINREEALRQIFLEAMGHDFDFNAEHRKIYISAKRAVKNTPAADVVSKELYEQIKWERDAALAQLKDYGVSLGEKADVVEVRHGRWERVIPTKSAAKWSTKVSCSQCHDQGYERYNYCPNCGAYMMGESNGKCE